LIGDFRRKGTKRSQKKEKKKTRVWVKNGRKIRINRS